MFTIKEVKAFQKEAAKEIKELKSKRKESIYGVVPGLWRASWDYRHWHIAYCLFRGRKMEEIERTNRSDNHPYKSLIEQCLSKIKPSVREEKTDE